MNIVIMGPQGSGKGTQAKKLKGILGISHISTGDMFREAADKRTELGLRAKNEYWEKGNLVPDEITNQIVKERLAQKDCKKGYVLDGYPRTLDQAKALDKITKVGYVILINISDEQAIERICGRRSCAKCGKIYHIKTNPSPKGNSCICGGKLIQREDDTEAKLKVRLESYHKQTEPVIEYYRKKGVLSEFDGRKGIDELFSEIEKKLKK